MVFVEAIFELAVQSNNWPFRDGMLVDRLLRNKRCSCSFCCRSGGICDAADHKHSVQLLIRQGSKLSCNECLEQLQCLALLCCALLCMLI